MIQTTPKPQIIYPEPDGAPVAESDPARNYLFYGVETLKRHFKTRSDVYVSGNLYLAYGDAENYEVVCPDVFIVFGVEKHIRSSYFTWENEGKTPDWVLEVMSKGTWQNDDYEDEKPKTYAGMGVTEYFQYDPSGKLIKPPLKGRRLVGKQYKPISLKRLEDGTLSLPSQVLGLEMQLLPDGRLRFFNPQTGEYLRDFDEAEDRGDQERERANREQQEKELQRERAERAEARAKQLAAKLQALGIDPDT